MMEEIRAKSRRTQQDCRQHHRSNALNSKRLHLNEILELGEYNRLDEIQMKSLSKSVKSTKDQLVLKKLKLAFAQGDGLHQVFFKTEGALQGLIGLLTCREINVQLEAAACIINLLTVCDHQETFKVAKLSVPYFTLYLQSSGANLQELSAWALGNVAADCSTCCNLLKAHKFCQSIFGLLECWRSPEVIYSALFALKCYMNHQATEWSEIMSMGLANRLPIFMKSPENENILAQVANIMFYLSTNSENDDYLLHSGCVQLCIHHLNEIISRSVKDGQIYLSKSQCQIATYLIRSLAGVAENYDIANAILSAVDLSTLSLMLTCNYLHIHKETLWLLSNLASHKITTAMSCPWHCEQLLTITAGRLLETDETVEQVLTFLGNVLTVHGWHPSLPSISTLVNEDAAIRLLCSSNHTTVDLTLKLLTIIYNDENNFTKHNYSDKLSEVIHDMCFMSGDVSNLALNVFYNTHPS